MIPRYTRPEMAEIWTAQTRFRIWFEIEAHAADAMAELGLIPKSAARTIWDKGRNAIFDVDTGCGKGLTGTADLGPGNTSPTPLRQRSCVE